MNMHFQEAMSAITYSIDCMFWRDSGMLFAFHEPIAIHCICTQMAWDGILPLYRCGDVISSIKPDLIPLGSHVESSSTWLS